MDDQTETITVFFGVFGHRVYRMWKADDLAAGGARIPCRWCVGEGMPTLNCAGCKNTRWMWIGI